MNPFLLLIIALAAVALVFQAHFVWYLVFIGLALYLWVWWAVPRALRSLYYGRRYNPYAFWGEIVPITVHVQNHSWLPVPWLRLSETIAVQLRHGRPNQALLTIGPQKSAQFTYQIQARRRGYYQIGPLHISGGDLFGLRPDIEAQLPADYLTVYPRITPLTQLGLPSRLPFGTLSSQQRLFEDPQRPLGVRPFRSGDSLRQINWKASAHTQQMLVKTFAPAISLQTAVLLDLNLDGYQRQSRHEQSEWAIEVAASLAAHLIELRQAVGLFSNGIDPLANAAQPHFDEQSGRLLSHTAVNPPTGPIPVAVPVNHGRDHLIKLLQQLARIEASAATPLAAWAGPATAQLSWGTTVVAITAKADEPIYQALQQLLRNGFNPILVCVQPDAHFNRVRQQARQAGFRAYQLPDSQALAQWPAAKQPTSH